MPVPSSASPTESASHPGQIQKRKRRQDFGKTASKRGVLALKPTSRKFWCRELQIFPPLARPQNVSAEKTPFLPCRSPKTMPGTWLPGADRQLGKMPDRLSKKFRQRFEKRRRGKTVFSVTTTPLRSGANIFRQATVLNAKRAAGKSGP